MLSPSSSRTFVRVSFLVLVTLFASLLTARYKLEEAPYNRPYGKPVNLGHQANQIAFSRTVAKPAPAADAGQVDAATGEEVADDGLGSDWWDDAENWDIWGMTTTKSGWDPLEADTTPFTELQVKTCVLSPGLYDMCSPTSSAKEDATKGKWERIDRDISKKAGIYYLYLYARRLLPGSNADVITDLRLLDHRPTTSDLSDDGLWVEVSTSIREGVWPRMTPLFLHYKLTPQADVLAARKESANNGSAGALEPITELDILYGASEVQPLPGFTKVEHMISGGEDDAERVGLGKGKRVGSTLTYRKEQTKLPATPVLRFSNAGNFTILQVADLHFSVGPGECRDMDSRRAAECRAAGADVYSLRWLETALDEVKPDLVVLSGDQLNGQKTSWDARSVILKWAPLLWKRNIPWTVIFGNHDEEETDLDHEQQMALMQRLPLFLGEPGPTNVAGTGNYVRSIRAPAAAQDDAVLFNLYFLDSHAYAKKLTPWGHRGYDYLKADQINWFRGRSAQMKPFLRPYTPPHALTPATKPTSKRPGRPGRPNRLPPAGSDARSAFAQTKGRRAVVVEERQGASSDTGEFGIEIEPDDGSRVVKTPNEAVQFEADDAEDEDEVNTSANADSSSASPSGKETEDLPQGSTNALLEAEEELIEDEGFFEPTELPQGPTALNPMQAKPNAMTFFHIPLKTSYEAAIDIAPSGKRLRVGERLEGSGASKTDSGFFESAILAQGELPVSRGDGDTPVDAFWDGEAMSPTTGRPEVKVLAHGHCHITSDCRRVQGVWICFGGGATYSGYGSSAFSRRMRVYQLSNFGERTETYQLTDDKERVNAAMLYGDGSLEEQ